MNKQIYSIPKPPVFSFEECLWFLDRGYDECLYRVAPTHVTRAIDVLGASFLCRIVDGGDVVKAEVLNEKPTAQQAHYIINYIRDWFDLATDLSPFYRLLQAHKKLAYMSDDFNGLVLMGMPDIFEALCWSITGQQINLAFAYRLKRRLVEAYGRQLIFEDTAYHLFPEPARLAGLQVPELRAMQFSDKKAEYLITVAQAFAGGRLSKEKIIALPDFESRQKALTALRGIGVWTANYALMKSLREPGSVPHGDVGLLNALKNHGIIKERNEVQKIEKLFRQFKGWECYLVTYLWRSLAVKKKAVSKQGLIKG